MNRHDKQLEVILVTGGTGFLGSTLIDQLLQAGKTVRAIKRSASAIPQLLVGRERLSWVEGDVTDYFSLEEAFSGIQQVYHCAAMVSYQPADKSIMMHTNVEGTANVVNLCMLYQVRVIHVSSIAALGEARNGDLVTEKDMWEYTKGQSAYSVSKYESEMEVWRGISEGLDAIIVNPSLIIGHQIGKRGSGTVFHLLYKGLDYYPGGSVGLVDVEDVARSMILLMDKSEITQKRFIINNVNLSHQEMLSRASALMGKNPPQKKATYLMLELAWWYSSLKSKLTGKKSALTKESARVSSKKLRYSNEKLVNAIPIEFKPIDLTLSEISKSVLSSYN